MVNFLKSKLKAKLYAYYFDHPGAELYLRELARLLKEDASNLARELNKLEKKGTFASEFKGKQKYFKLNKNYPLYRELKNIIAKSVGIESALEKAVKNLDGVLCAFIYGSRARSEDKAGSDIDLFLIGADINKRDLLEKISLIEKKIGREINYRIFSPRDLEKEIEKGNSFIENVVKSKKIFIKGDEKNFRKFSQSRFSSERKRNKIRPDY
ncbi:MAG: nucleotidyltransferase domain-containing protein [Patescibacteria group bacterium]|jgi:predicted nucleotidyltransferase